MGEKIKDGWRGRWEGGSGCGTHVNPWLFHFNVWQNPLQIKNNNNNKKRWDMQKMNRKIVGLNPTISIITLNVDGLNMPIKDIDYLAKLKKEDWTYVFYKNCILNMKTQVSCKWKKKRKKIDLADINYKKARVGILLSDKLNLVIVRHHHPWSAGIFNYKRIN